MKLTNKIGMVFFVLTLLIVISSFASALEIADLTFTSSKNSITVDFKTDQLTNTTIEFGVDDPSQTYSSGDYATEHSHTLENLEENADYKIKVVACSENECAESDLMDAETKEVEMFLQYQFLNPQKTKQSDVIEDDQWDDLFNSAKINLIILSKPEALVSVYVNDDLKRYQKLSSSGRYNFKDVALDSDLDVNTIRIKSDYGGEVIEKTLALTLDLVPPNVELENTSDVLMEDSYEIRGKVDEFVSVKVYANDEKIDEFDIDAGSFNKTVNGIPDGDVSLVMLFTDEAGNNFKKTILLYVDTEEQFISLDESIPSNIYVDTVQITGETKPYSNVVVYVNNKTGDDGPWKSDTVANEIVSSFEKLLGLKLVSAKSSYSTKADGDGEFSITVKLPRSLEVAQYPDDSVSDPNFVETQVGLPKEYSNDITIVSVDRVGRYKVQGPQNVVISSCDSGGYWDFDTISITPSAIQPIHLRLGIASIGMNFKLNWQGPGDSEKATATVTNVQPMDDDELGGEGKYIYNQLISSSSNYYKYDNQLQMGTITLNLRQFGEINDSFTGQQDILNELLGTTNINFYLKVDISYTYDESGTGELKNGHQIKCLPISVDVDKDVITEEKIPKKLLNNSIEVMAATEKTVKKARETVDYVHKAALIGFVGTYVMDSVMSIKQKMACFEYAGNGFIPDVPPSNTLDADQTCDDTDNPESCNTCWDAIKTKLKVGEKAVQWTGDRIFCPAVPSFHEFVRKDYLSPSKFYYYGESEEDESGIYMGRDANGKWKSICADTWRLLNATVTTWEEFEPYIDEDTGYEEHRRCVDYYESKWTTACPLYSSMVKDSFPEGEKGKNLFEKLVDTLSFCSTQEESTKGVLIKKNKCYPLDNYLTTKDVAINNCYFVVNDNKVYEVESYDQIISLDQQTKEEIESDDRSFVVSLDNSNQQITRSKDDIKTVLAEMMRKTDNDVTQNEIDLKYAEYLKRNGLYSYINMGESLYVVDPTAGLLRSIQCGCISGTRAYLKQLEAITGGLKQCFQSILLTGSASAGMCRSLMTQYLCDIIYDMIKCSGKVMGVLGERMGGGVGDNEISGLGKFMSVMSSGADQVSDGIEGRYGTTSTFRALFSERTMLRQACLGAFFGDWNVRIDNLLDSMNREFVVDSEIFLHPSTRRFMSSDPTTGYASHIYHVGFGIVAGADVSYSVYLVCSNDQSCDASEGFVNGQCDCFGKEEQKVSVRTGYIENGEMKTYDDYKQLSSPYRYDTVLVEYRYNDLQRASSSSSSSSLYNTQMQQQQNMYASQDSSGDYGYTSGFTSTSSSSQGQVVKQQRYKISQIGASPPVDCQYDVLSLQFLCSFEVSDDNLLAFPVTPSPSKEYFNVGDLLTVKGKFSKRNPTDRIVPTYMFVKVVDQNGNADFSYVYDVSDEGIYDLESYKDDAIQFIGVPGVEIEENWFSSSQSGVSGEYGGVNSAKLGTSNYFRALVTGSMPGMVTINYNGNADGNQGTSQATGNIKLQFDQQKMTITDKDGNEVTNNAPIEYNYAGPVVLNVQSKTGTGGATIRIEGIALQKTEVTNGQINSLLTDTITIMDESDETITRTIVLEFYNGDEISQEAISGISLTGTKSQALITSYSIPVLIKKELSVIRICPNNIRYETMLDYTGSSKETQCKCGDDLDDQQTCSAYCIVGKYCMDKPQCVANQKFQGDQIGCYCVPDSAELVQQEPTLMCGRGEICAVSNGVADCQ